MGVFKNDVPKRRLVKFRFKFFAKKKPATQVAGLMFH
jgi:hypothetical protein